MSPERRERQRILFLEQFYWPEGWGGAELPRTLTMHLARLGLDVEVICGTEQYAPLEDEDPALGDPRGAGVRITRVPALLEGDFRRHKLLRQLWFYVAALPRLLVRRPPALLMQQTNPPLLVVLCALAATLWRRPLVIIAMDLYPEVVVASGLLDVHDWRARVLGRIFRWAYGRARVVVSLGPVMTERLLSKGVDGARIVQIENWATGAQVTAPDEARSLREDWGLEGRFVVLYSGNLGVAHEFDTFLEGFARAILALPQLAFVVVGRGSRLPEVRARVAALGLHTHVSFHDFVPAAQLPAVLGVADVALVTLRHGFEGLVVPSKLYGYLARALPVLYVGPRSDTSLEVERCGAGITTAAGNVGLVFEALLRLAREPEAARRMGESGRRAYELSLAAKHAMARYAAVVRSCLQAET